MTVRQLVRGVFLVSRTLLQLTSMIQEIDVMSGGKILSEGFPQQHLRNRPRPYGRRYGMRLDRPPKPMPRDRHL